MAEDKKKRPIRVVGKSEDVSSPEQGEDLEYDYLQDNPYSQNGFIPLVRKRSTPETRQRDRDTTEGFKEDIAKFSGMGKVAEDGDIELKSEMKRRRKK
jgi:hypothetical protein